MTELIIRMYWSGCSGQANLQNK